jgi:hypothetical protein
MDCEERMVKQVQLTVAASPNTKVFVCKFVHCVYLKFRNHRVYAGSLTFVRTDRSEYD